VIGGRVILFHLGPLPISRTVATTWGVMAVLVVAAWVLARDRREPPRGVFLLPELFLRNIEELAVTTMGPRGRAFTPFLATVALFVTASNLSGIFPGVTLPTADLSTVTAVGGLVLAVVHATGIRTRGLRGYISAYFQPFWWLFPLNVIGVLARPLSHVFRLYGNMVGGGILISVAALLSPWIVPVPVVAWFGVFIGIIQGLVFTLLAAVYIAEAME
jgi:F-type H+-transporting ATPase subunit a